MTTVAEWQEWQLAWVEARLREGEQGPGRGRWEQTGVGIGRDDRRIPGGRRVGAGRQLSGRRGWLPLALALALAA